MSLAVTQNLTIEQGASFSQPFQYLQSDGVTPVDLTGVTAASKIRDAYGGNVIAEFATSIDVPTGTITLTLTDEQTELLAATTTAVWDLKLHWPAAHATRLVQGSVTITPEVTDG